MEKSKILTADLLDLIFDDRNKDYGAYELRKTYDSRIKKALFATFTIAALAIAGSVLAKNFKPPIDKADDNIVVIREIDTTPEDIKPPEEQPKPEPEPETRTEKLNNIVIAPNDEVDEPLATQDDLKIADIGDEKKDGVDDIGISDPVKDPDDGKNIIDIPKPDDEDIIHTTVQVHARYSGNWEKFLVRNLNAEVPRDNGAGPGRYTVQIKFVVDKEGHVSEIKAITNIGFGMEEEAMRVLKKADLWEPAIQGGYKVKAYHTQTITFVVPEDE